MGREESFTIVLPYHLALCINSVCVCVTDTFSFLHTYVYFSFTVDKLMFSPDQTCDLQVHTPRATPSSPPQTVKSRYTPR